MRANHGQMQRDSAGLGGMFRSRVYPAQQGIWLNRADLRFAPGESAKPGTRTGANSSSWGWGEIEKRPTISRTISSTCRRASSVAGTKAVQGTGAASSRRRSGFRRIAEDAAVAGWQAAIDLYWLPLGAGGHSVRLNGKVFELFAARAERRDRCDLYHSALQVYVPEGRFVIEQAPAWGEGSRRGVVAEGAVGVRALGRFRLFRYEIRSWREGVIPDIAEAVQSPVRLSDEPDRSRRLLELAPQVPTPVWGRDELGAGEMWNSNSTVSWLLARSGLDVESIQLPHRGRAPGWNAGITIARREPRR